MPNKTKPIPKEKINSPIFPMKNSKVSILKLNQTATELEKNSLLPENQLDPSIGSPKVKSKLLKIKDNVDLAGLFQQLLQLNPVMPFSDHNLEISLNNNLLIVCQEHVTDVEEEK